MQQDDQPHSMLDAGVSERQKGMLGVPLPPFKSFSGWDISGFHDRWDLIEAKLKV